MVSTITIPRRLPLLSVADNVLLPGSSMRIPVRSMRNINMVKSRLLSRSTLSSTIIGVIPREPVDDQIDDLSSLHPIGTAAVVVQVTGTNWPKPSYTLLVTEEKVKSAGELDALAENFREQAAKLVDMLDISIPVVAKLKKMLENLPSQHLPDICAAIVKASYSEKIQVLDAVDLTERFRKALPLLMRQIEGLQLLQKARKDRFEIITRREGGNRPGNMRRAFGKISSEMDDDEDDIDEMMDLEQKIKAANMPEHAMKAAMKELKRMKKMPQQMPEHAMIRNYLELMVELPWSKSSKDALDIVQARKDLDEDHYGLEKLKKRVLEYLAVRQLKNTLKGPILCFVGPPGVGKTSVGKSIAQTLGREFHRCPVYTSLPSFCKMESVEGVCCKQVKCDQSHSHQGGVSANPITTLPPKPTCSWCKDEINNCDAYGHQACVGLYADWANRNCKSYCNLCDCQHTTPAPTTPTTQPADCHDNFDCTLYGKDSCTGVFAPWARENCKYYCGFCGNGGGPGVGTTAPTATLGCVDTNPDACANFGSSVCTNVAYISWSKINCKKTCNFCDDSQTSGTVDVKHCTYNDGKIYNAGQTWLDGCEKNCTCLSTGVYQCTKLCPEWVDLPPNWVLVQVEGQCCPNIEIARQDQCHYKGHSYNEGQHWQDGCKLNCQCTDGKNGLYACKEKCPEWNLPPACHWENPAPGKCCHQPVCPPQYTFKEPYPDE